MEVRAFCRVDRPGSGYCPEFPRRPEGRQDLRLPGFEAGIAAPWPAADHNDRDSYSADHPEKLLEEISRLFDDVSNDADLIRFTSPGGLPVTLRVVEPARFGAALLHGTGNDAHWAELTALAGSRSLRLDRNGLFDGDDLLSAPDESSVCSKLGIDPIPAEAREGSGEIDLARSGKFPVLIEE